MFLVANLVTNLQDFVAKVENLVALAPVLGAISRLGLLLLIIIFCFPFRIWLVLLVLS